MAGLRWTFVLLAALLFAAQAAPALAQYAEGLPPGLVAAEIDNQPIDAVNVPIVDSPTPQISGRLNTGQTAVELAIADGEIVRFTLEVDARGRFRGQPPDPLAPGQYALYVFDALVGTFVVSDAAAGTPRARDGGGGGPSDIARAVPEVPDFGGAIPGLALLEGRHASLDDEARRIAALDGDDSREAVAAARDELQASGFRQRYESRLAVPDPADPARFALQVSSFAVEYADPRQAADAFAAATGAGAAIASAPVGQASELIALSGTTPDTGAAYQALRLLYVQDRVFGLIVLADLLGGVPDQALLEVVAQTAAARAAAVSAGDLRGAGTRVLRLDAPAASELAADEGYQVVDGLLVPLYGEDDGGQAARIALFTGSQEAYVLDASGVARQDGGQGAAATERVVAYGSTVIAFPSPEEAAVWIANLPTLIANDPLRGYAAFDPVSAAPLVGEESAVFEVTRDSDPALQGFRAYLRVGSDVAIVELAADQPATIDEALALASTQAACLERGRCPDPEPVPGFAEERTGDEAATTPAPTPGTGGGQTGGVRDVGAETPTPVPGETADEGAITVAPGADAPATSDSAEPTAEPPRGGVRDVTPPPEGSGG